MLITQNCDFRLLETEFPNTTFQVRTESRQKQFYLRTLEHVQIKCMCLESFFSLEKLLLNIKLGKPRTCYPPFEVPYYSITDELLSLQRIPDEFITRFGNELKNVAAVTVPDGRDWKMRLKKRGNDIFFCNEWQEFAKYYSLGYGCYLSFKYEGNSKFSVIIFDVTSVEICYTLKTPSTNGETNTQCPTPMKNSRVETSSSQGKKLKIMFEHASKSAKDAANEFNPKNPYFCSNIAKRNLVVRILLCGFWLKVNVELFIF